MSRDESDKPHVDERYEKAFPVSWDQFHRDARALAWRLSGQGPFNAVVAVTRGGLVPAAIVARELGVRVIETVCVASYDYGKQGDLQVLKSVDPSLAGDEGVHVLIVDDLVDTGKTASASCLRLNGLGRKAKSDSPSRLRAKASSA